MKIEYKRFNSLWRRISFFFDKHWFLEWLITIVSIFGGCVVLAIFIISLEMDKTTNLAENNKLYKHVIAIERTYGVTDSLIYHDVNTGVEVKLSENDKKLYVTTKGVNWLGISVNNNVTFENTKSFKIIK